MSTRTYSKIMLRQTAPWWPPHIPGASSPDRAAYEAPGCRITREDGDSVYDVLHVESGERAEVPVHMVRVAVRKPDPKPAPVVAPAPAQKGKR